MDESEETPLVEDVNGARTLPASAYDDSPEEMTLTRRLAQYLSQFEWYHPAGSNYSVSLDDAWAYFEHITLPRYFLDTNTDDNDHFPKAEPGETEKKTKLYPVLSTPETDLADFGIGVGVYFLTLRMIAIIMFIAGVLSLPNTYFFWSDSYNSAHEFSDYEIMRTSAVCSDHTWEACPSCTKSQLNYFPVTFERYAEAPAADGTSKLIFMEVNNCSITKTAGIVSYITMLFVCGAMFLLAKYTRHREAVFDAASQTTSDYSVEVVNPPGDAKNVDEWKDYFEQFGCVTAITIALDNEELLKVLTERRSLLLSLEQLQPPGEEFDPKNLDKAFEQALPVPKYMQTLMGYWDGPGIQKRVKDIDELVETDLSKRDYQVSNVFVIFEEESSQQKTLQAIQLSGKQLFFQDSSSLRPEYIFRGSHLLRVTEPPEPSGVRWQDLDEDLLTQVKQRLVTMFLTIICILCGCVLVIFFRLRYDIILAAFAVSGVNSGAPYVCRFLVSYESHASEGSRQASLYYKITAFLWMTTAMLTSIITPFVDTLETKADSLVPAMYSIFITEMFVGPATQLADIYGNMQRHIFAPRARSQKLMSSYFQGTPYDLSERYTNVTNVLFLTFYYALLFPAGFFFASATLGIIYWTDKYCLLRMWSPAPAIGNDIASMSRIYFFSTALVVYALMSSYGFASFPYDNACIETETIPAEYVGSFQAETGDGRTVDIELTTDHNVYQYCNQDMLQYKPIAFPPLPSKQIVEWMSPGQAEFATIYGYTFVVIVLSTMFIMLNQTRRVLSSMFVSPFVEHSTNTCVTKKYDPDLGAYIPQSKLLNDLFPILFCDLGNIDEELIPWVDPDQPYAKHNAIYDIEGLHTKPVFSTIHHWPSS